MQQPTASIPPSVGEPTVAPATQAPTPQTPPPEALDPSKRLGVAILGLGSYASRLLGPGLQLTQNCYFAGLITGTPSKIPEWQQKYSIKDSNIYTYDTMAEIANNPEIDVVYVVTPTSTHADFAIRAANAGKHVWCEKPLAMNVEDSQAIIDACNRNNVRLSVGYRLHHEPNTRAIMDIGRTRPYGAVISAEAMAGYAGGGGTTWRFVKSMGGGALFDMGVYSINALRQSLGQEPTRVVSARMWTDRPAEFVEVDEHAEFELEFPDGLTAYGKTSVGQEINHVRVECADGWYDLRPLQHYTGITGTTSDGKLFNEVIPHQQARQMDNDAKAIVDGTPMIVPGEEGLRDVRIVQAIVQCAETNQPVSLA